MAYVTTPLIGINTADMSSNPTAVVSTQVTDTNDTTWEYVYFASNAVTGNAVYIAGSGTASLLTSANAALAGEIGFVQQAAAAGQYGWVALKGRNIQMAVLADCDSGVPLWTTDTAGYLDDATNTVSQYQVMGALIIATNSGSASNVAGIQQSFPIIRRNAAGM